MSYEVGVLDVLRDFGINFTEEPSCRSRGSINFSPRAVMAHHTGADTDVTAMLRDGRPGLGGPLCNFELRRHGRVHCIALGRANHAGAGDFRGLSGNSYFWGIEASSAGKTWTDAQREMYPLLSAALCAYSGVDESWVGAHKEYAGYRGKWDPGNWDMHWHRERTRYCLLHRSKPEPELEEEDMPTLYVHPDGHTYMLHGSRLSHIPYEDAKVWEELSKRFGPPMRATKGLLMNLAGRDGNPGGVWIP